MKVLITGGSGFIGINLIEHLLSKGILDIMNIDKVSPIIDEHKRFWYDCNIMDELRIYSAFEKFNPDYVIHLAARTDTLSDKLEDYDENHIGTQNLINVIKKFDTIKRVLITSTQYVYKSEDLPFPTSGQDYKPHTIYGQSKVLTEQYTRSADLKCEWVIIRPTNIWGPWHMRYPNELWRIIDKGMYFHPVRHEVIRTYGYVKNIVHQIYNIATAPSELVHTKVFYLGDPSIDSYKWLNELSIQLAGKKIKRLPKIIFRVIALGGDILRTIKIPFPLYSKRFNNMVEDYPAPTEKTVELFGVAESDLSKNVAETVSWINGKGKRFFPYWNNK